MATVAFSNVTRGTSTSLEDFILLNQSINGTEVTRKLKLDELVNTLNGIVYDVDSFPYNAVGDGASDDTARIQAAINDAHNAGGGIVVLGPKKYFVTFLDVKEGVLLKGVRRPGTYRTSNNYFSWLYSDNRYVTYTGTISDSSIINISPPLPDDPWFVIKTGSFPVETYNIGDRWSSTTLGLFNLMSSTSGSITFKACAPTVGMETNSDLFDLGFHNPNQTPTVSPPLDCSPCVSFHAASGNDVSRLFFNNSAEGLISCMGIASCNISHLYGFPLRLGAFIAGVVDMFQVERMLFNANNWQGVDWSQSANKPLADWVNINAVAFRFGRIDWFWTQNLFCFGYGTGFLLSATSIQGTYSPLGICPGTFYQCGADICATDVRIIVDTNGSGEFILFDACMFTAGEMNIWDSDNSALAGRVLKLECGRENFVVKFRDCTTWGPAKTFVESTNTGGLIVEGGSGFRYSTDSEADSLYYFDTIKLSKFELKGFVMDGRDISHTRGVRISADTKYSKIKDNIFRNIGDTQSRPTVITVDNGTDRVTIMDNEFENCKTEPITDNSTTTNKRIGHNFGSSISYGM